jgi:itaconyl-CoA hydratase
VTDGERKIGSLSVREGPGRYYEEFAVGDQYQHHPGRTISEADNTWFSLLTMNQNPLHIDADYSSQTEFGQPLVNSCLTLAILVGLSVPDVSYKTVANLGWNDIRLTAPVFAGDTIYAESQVIAMRESKSRPTQGIVTVKTTGRKADGTVFMSFERTILVPKIGHGIGD